KENPVAKISGDLDDPTIVPPPHPPPPPSAGWPVVGSHEVWPPAAQPWPQRAEPFPAQPPTTSPSAAIDLSARRGARFFASRTGRITLIAAAVVLLLAIALLLAVVGAPSGEGRATLQVVSVPPGAEVVLDEKKLDRVTPIATEVDAQLLHHVRV